MEAIAAARSFKNRVIPAIMILLHHETRLNRLCGEPDGDNRRRKQGVRRSRNHSRYYYAGRVSRQSLARRRHSAFGKSPHPRCRRSDGVRSVPVPSSELLPVDFAEDFIKMTQFLLVESPQTGIQLHPREDELFV
ncbi:uncharacterized protein LOC111460020 [Cucurbita moschata]|uniref:Uncharacterized protein LOC111460020 n=1 Tax=Cucurbita moschata TaxID=3662 RepID=A0A6J1H3C0_CUCMO|nr:uncharacterized protein LOC111460020 [Cucurbita moschata]